MKELRAGTRFHFSFEIEIMIDSDGVGALIYKRTEIIVRCGFAIGACYVVWSNYVMYLIDIIPCDFQEMFL